MSYLSGRDHRPDGVPNAVLRLGFWSAVLCPIFGLAFSVAAIVDRFGIPAPPWTMVPLMAPSFFPAPPFVVLMACVHHCATEDRRVRSHVGLAYAIVYAVRS